MSCFKTNALIHLIQALGAISHNISTTELNVHAKNFTKDLVCINKLDNKHSEKIPNRIPWLLVGQCSEDHTCRTKFQNTRFVHCSSAEGSQSCLCWKIAFLLPVLLKTCRLLRPKNKSPLVPSLSLFTLPSQILTHMHSFRNYNLFLKTAVLIRSEHLR